MDKYLQNNLNEEQYTAATHTQTSSLILAGAGSGKTRVLTFKITYLIYQMKIASKRILAVTFTNKAANEMKERLIKLSTTITNDVLDVDPMFGPLPPLSPQDLKWVGTFHGVFLKILKEDIHHYVPAYGSAPTKAAPTEGLMFQQSEEKTTYWTKGFTIYDAGESQSLVKQLIKVKKRDDDIKPKEVKGKISRWKNEGKNPKEALYTAMSDLDEKAGEIYQLYQKELLKANALDFDDLLLIPYKLFTSNKDVLHKRQKAFDYILVDEAQDTNHIQFELIRMMSKISNNVTMIGDDYQSIYRWRGAVMENFLNVKQYWDDIVIHKLQINYRSRPHIVHAGSSLIKKNSTQYEKNIKAHRGGEDKISVFTHGDETEEAINTIMLIKKIKTAKDIPRGDIAILYRTNSQSQKMEQSLVQHSIPYKIFGGFKFFERKEIKDVVSYIRFIKNPQDNVAFKRIINTPSRKIGKTTIEKLTAYSDEHNLPLSQVIAHIESIHININGPTKTRIKQFHTQITYRLTNIGEQTPSQFINQVIHDIKYRDYLIDLDGDKKAAEEKYENIGQLINLSKKVETTGIDGLDELLEEISLLTDIEETEDGELDAVKLMTIHASKGLEFPIVFIVGCEENIFPLSRAILDTKELEEERRLMYVAITRAEDHLFLSHANSRMQWGQFSYNPPSRFLKDIPAEYTKVVDLTANYQSPSKGVSNTFDNGDYVTHKLFGEGQIVEIRGETAIVKFKNMQYGIRKITLKTLMRS